MIRVFLASNGHLTLVGVVAAFLLLFVVIPGLTGAIIAQEVRE
jgi:hypothetical protein